MMIIAGIFIILHGLVHLWYVLLSFQWIKFQPDMGWTGNSWILSSSKERSFIRFISGTLFIIAAISFLISGIGVFLNAVWWEILILVSVVFSSLILLFFWDGKFDMMIQKGVIGLLINFVIVAIILL